MHACVIMCELASVCTFAVIFTHTVQVALVCFTPPCLRLKSKGVVGVRVSRVAGMSP